jgi:microcystin-dependent protein
MGTPFISEIRMMSFGFAPKGWALCDGQLLPINQNQSLYSLLGNTYGGDGRTNFALPNLQGRTPIHMGEGFTLGERGGEQNHTLVISEIPTHVHFAKGAGPAADMTVNVKGAANNVLANALNLYAPPTNLTSLHPSTISSVGGSQPHLNMQPYLTLNFAIALQGIFPSQN